MQTFGHTVDPVRIELAGSPPLTFFGWHGHGTVSAVTVAEKIRAAENAVRLCPLGTGGSAHALRCSESRGKIVHRRRSETDRWHRPARSTAAGMDDGTPAAWSLGNLVFDERGPDAEWRRGALLEVTLSPSGGIVRCRLVEIPVIGGL
jgi:hypothetical protein